MAEPGLQATRGHLNQVAPLILPACAIGTASSLLLLLLSGVAELLADFLWDTLPDALGTSGNADEWIFLVLTLTGVAVGLVVWKAPHHAGPDPAAESLVSPPLAPEVLPGLALATALVLAGGVSLGPENPIMAINIALTVFLGTRYLRKVQTPQWVMLAVAGTVGALFGTPVAAALILSETLAGDRDTPLWDRLFLPLVAAGAGALTTLLIEPDLSFSLVVDPYPGPKLLDLLSASVIATFAALLGLVAVYAFPRLHAGFNRLPHPMLMLPLGGAILGVLGVIGGELTLFRGLDQMKELSTTSGDYSPGRLALFAAVKLVALLVAGTSGFVGGRIFPATFVGVAAGLSVSSLISDVPQALAVSAAVLGILLAVSRSGWLSLFMAATLVSDVSLLPVLAIALLPSWLVVAGQPQMVIPEAPNVPWRAAPAAPRPDAGSDEARGGRRAA